MTRFPAAALLVAVAFTGFGLRWELAQLDTWRRMIRNENASASWIGKLDRVLSGEAPCANCLRLSRSRVSGDAEAAFSIPPGPDHDSLWLNVGVRSWPGRPLRLHIPVPARSASGFPPEPSVPPPRCFRKPPPAF